MRNYTLEEIVKLSKSHKPTPGERRAQRISLMMGLRSNSSTVTREEVSIILDNIEGRTSTEEIKAQ